MKVVAFQHVHWETPGLIQSAVEKAGHTMEILHPADSVRAASVYETCSVPVVMGGPMSPNDDLDYLRAEM